MTDDPRDLLGPLEVPPTSPDLVSKTLAAAAPLLVAHARRTRARVWLRPLVVALLPLPLVVAVDVLVARALYALLSLFLPDVVTTYLVAQYLLLMLLLVGLTYAAVPVLADRQAHALLEEAHV
jgi:hypothetical protein